LRLPATQIFAQSRRLAGPAGIRFGLGTRREVGGLLLGHWVKKQ
jgi:hypothetical protein